MPMVLGRWSCFMCLTQGRVFLMWTFQGLLSAEGCNCFLFKHVFGGMWESQTTWDHFVWTNFGWSFPLAKYVNHRTGCCSALWLSSGGLLWWMIHISRRLHFFWIARSPAVYELILCKSRWSNQLDPRAISGFIPFNWFGVTAVR